MPMPPARTGPATSVTTGLSSVSSCRWRSTIAVAPSSMPPVVASLRSAPEQNTRPDERISTTLTRVVLAGRRHVRHQLGHQLPRQRVAVVRRVERDRRDRAVDLEMDELARCRRAVGHVRNLTHGVRRGARRPGARPARATPTTEKKMFGGLAFLVGGNMAVAASGKGGLMVRCDPRTPTPTWRPARTPFEMRGKPMNGWLRVTAEAGRRRRRAGPMGAGRRGPGGGTPAQVAVCSEQGA